MSTVAHTDRDTTDRLVGAVTEYRARATGTHVPDGAYIHGSWSPSPTETRPCCAHHRPTNQPYAPSQYPESARHHCLGMRHVAALYGVRVQDLRRALRAHP